MQIVINISDVPKNDHERWVLSHGIPLPKGHGDLIDRNSILCTLWSCNECGHTDECFRLLAPTILEADRSENENNR